MMPAKAGEQSERPFDVLAFRVAEYAPTEASATSVPGGSVAKKRLPSSKPPEMRAIDLLLLVLDPAVIHAVAT